ncbi:MAG: ATP-binding protein [Thermodesulfobacteriota bacterium]
MQFSATPSPRPPVQERLASSRIAFTWLLHLRWGAVIAQAILVLLVYLVLEVRLPYPILLGILGFEIASNLCFALIHRRSDSISTRFLALVLFTDAVLLSLLLHYSGGPMNPFTFLYLVHVAMAAILMPPRWSWGFALFTVACYAWLFLLPTQGSAAQCHTEPIFSALRHDPVMIHLQGMWVAFTVTVFFIVFFISRIQQALTRHQQALADLQAERTRNEKLASLATLAAGAAHEFATPLATIAVSAGEMLHELQRHPNISQDLIEDAALIREQVDRCKDILFQMSADAGEHMGEESREFNLHDLITGLLSQFPASGSFPVQYRNDCKTLLVTMPSRTVGRVIHSLLKNAMDASPDGAAIQLAISTDESMLRIEVKDQGTGMPPEVAARATEPFFTTKAPGKGMGLGLFLARSAAERFGGGLSISSQQGHGSTVGLAFSLQQIAARIGGPLS